MELSGNAGYRSDLQGLRAVAVSLVVLAHAGVPGFAGGFVGVDVFFVLSGYLITGILVREYAVDRRIRVASFIARRLRRLLPALLAMLTAVMFFASVFLSSHEFSEQTASVGYAASWTSNFYFALTTFDYFSELHLRDLFLHTWSLGVEEQFYLLWPLVLLSMFAGGGKSTSLSLARRLRFGLAIVFAASLIVALYWINTESLWAFYMMPARVWQFALGAGVFVYVDWFHHRRDDAGGGWYASVGVGIVGLAMILGSAMLLHPDLLYPGLWAMLPSFGAALVIASGGQGARHTEMRLLSHPVMVWVGDRSYSWYLWHWPILMLGFAWGLQGNPSATVALIVLAFLIASVSYRYVELPFWKGRFSKVPPMRSIVVALVGILMCSAGLVQANLAYRDSEERAATLARLARHDLPRLGGKGCDTWYSDATVVPCVHNPDGRRTVVLIGDSVGVQWLTAIKALYGAPDWRLVVFTKSACALVDEDYHYGVAGGIYTVCREWRDGMLDVVKGYQPEVIFVGSTSTYGFTEEQWVEGSRRVLEHLTAAASDRVYVIPGTPLLSFDGPGCVERWLTQHAYSGESPVGACREQMANAQPIEVAGYLRRAADSFANADVLDLTDLVCPDGICSARSQDGLVVYRDRRHLTNTFVRARTDAVGDRLRQLDSKVGAE